MSKATERSSSVSTAKSPRSSAPRMSESTPNTAVSGEWWARHADCKSAYRKIGAADERRERRLTRLMSTEAHVRGPSVHQLTATSVVALSHGPLNKDSRGLWLSARRQFLFARKPHAFAAVRASLGVGGPHSSGGRSNRNSGDATCTTGTCT